MYGLAGIPCIVVGYLNQVLNLDIKMAAQLIVIIETVLNHQVIRINLLLKLLPLRRHLLIWKLNGNLVYNRSNRALYNLDARRMP